MEDRGEAVEDWVEVDLEYSSPGLAVEEQPSPQPPAATKAAPSAAKSLTANFGLGGPFDGGINAGGWPQEESPPSPNGSVPHWERCGRKGHVARICRAPPRFEGICGICGQYGHRMRSCI